MFMQACLASKLYVSNVLLLALPTSSVLCLMLLAALLFYLGFHPNLLRQMVAHSGSVSGFFC